MADRRKKGKEFYGAGKTWQHRQLMLARSSRGKASESATSSANVDESSVLSSNAMTVPVTPTVAAQTPSASTSATAKKFDYQRLLRETAIPGDDEPEESAEEDDSVHETLSTGQQLIASAAKADRKRLRQSVRQEATRTKEARRADKLYRVEVRGSSGAKDYGDGAF